METTTESTSQPFDIDAILREFNADSPAVSTVSKEDSAVTRVRESFGLGRSLFKRKQSPIQQDTENTQKEENETLNEDISTEKSFKPRKRILDSDDEEDLPIVKPVHRSSSIVSSVSDDSDSQHSPNGKSTPNSPISDDDLPSTEALLADFRKARLEALAAKVAAKNRIEDVDAEKSPPPSGSRNASPQVERRQKVRKASKKTMEQMDRETQRMARNMALRPEIKPAKKIDMNNIFEKFGFNPQATKKEGTTSEGPPPEEEIMEEVSQIEIPGPPPKPIQQPKPATPKPKRDIAEILADSDSDSDISLPSPTKLFSKPKTPPKPKNPTHRKVQFTIQRTATSDSDSDVEIIPPPKTRPIDATKAKATPERTRKRTALLRSLANIKSPLKSPGRITQKELDTVLSREAALQAAKKREERRAELKSLGIDVEKVIEKRDLLEEAREEARRVRLEEGGEESDEEYVDEDEVDDRDMDESDADDENGGSESGSEGDEEDAESMEGDEGSDEDESGVEMKDVVQDEPKKRKAKKLQITSDDEEESESRRVIPQSTVGSEPQQPKVLSDFQQKDDLSLSQFFTETQLSGFTQKTAPKSEGQNQTADGETGLTQFFTSTALDEDLAATGEDAAHNRMDGLRQDSYDKAPIRETSPALVNADETIRANEVTGTDADASDIDDSPIRRRILKRRKSMPKKSKDMIDLNSEEFKESKKEFIEEQAEESEDEYAAWRSGDESENENMDGVVDGLIDDDTKINEKKVEKEVAQLYMEGERERDEKFVQGLMHDLQNGGLRRRRGTGLDMGDWSDDDDEDAEERRRRWELRREEMKRRMLEDENLGKLANNPKAQAFLNAISANTTLNFDDEPDFLGDDVIEDTRASTAARALPNSAPMGESQSQSQSQQQDPQLSAEIQVPATNSGEISRYERDRQIIEELTQVEDSQPMLLEDISLSEASDSELEETPEQSFNFDKTYTGFIDRAAQKRAARTASETSTRFAFKAVTATSPDRVKRTAVTVVEPDDELSRKKIMREVVGSNNVKRKTWGAAKGRGAVTYRGSSGNKENKRNEMKKKGDGHSEKRKRDMLILMDSQNSFC